MADPNTRTGKRTPVTLKIKFKSETIEQFIERYAVDVSQGGIFIRTKEPLAVGTQMRFEFQLRDASPLIAGEGTVVWTRENDPSRPAIAPGMGVRFDRLAEGSPTVLERILSEKLKQVPARTGADTTKPPLFRDEPTRVAPAPSQEMLKDLDSKPAQARTVSRSAMPFHSDADEFPEEAFEEQTKVRSLDELVAQTAQANNDTRDTPDPARELFGSGPAMNTTIIPPDELAMRRQQARQDATIDDTSAANSSPLLEPPPPAAEPRNIPEARDSAPSLPNPPSAPAPMPQNPSAGREPRLLDTTPSPRAESGLASDSMGKTQLGMAAPAPTTKPGVSAPTDNKPAPSVAAAAMLSPEAKPAAVAAKAEAKATAAEPPAAVGKPSKPSNRPISEPSRPLKKPSIMPIVVIVIAFVAAAAAAVWFLILKDTVDEDLVTKSGKTQPIAPTPTPNQALTPEQPAVPPGSGAVAALGSNGSAAVAPTPPTPPAPDVKLVDTVVAAPGADKATVTIDGTTFSGPAPLTAKLEPGKVYKAHVAAAGFLTLDLDVKGGAPATAKLVAKPKLLTVTSDPVGAQIIIEGTAVGHVTPFDVDIRPFGAKTKLHVTLRKAGFKPSDAVVDVSAPADDGAKLTVAAPAATLVVAPVPAYVPPRPPPVNKGSGSGDGTTPPPTGDTPPATPPPVTPPSGPSPPATQPLVAPPDTGAASPKPPKPPDGEPAPDFAK